MRWVTSLAAAALLAGCGNYSTEDLEFLEATPTRQVLQLSLPGPAVPAAGAQAAVACGPLGEASGWTQARAIGVTVNAGLDWILRVVDHLRAADPSHRARDERGWGPFPDSRHPGVESRIRLTRTFAGDLPTYHFFFESRRGGDWQALITGDFVGAWAARGHGTVTLHFGAIRALGVNDSAADPDGDVPIAYDRRGDPRTLGLTIPGAGGFGLLDFPYTWSSWSDGEGSFDYAVRDAAGNRVVWHARFSAAGAGRGDVTIFPANPPPASYTLRTCWDPAGCYVGVNDPFNVANICGAAASCVTPLPDWSVGCPAVRP